MPIFANARDIVFQEQEERVFEFEEGRWWDLYALLNVERNATPAAIEEAIIERGAGLLALAFSRGIRNDYTRALRHCYLDMRPILLNPEARQAYDEQLAWHEAHDGRAQHYEEWRAHMLQLTGAARLGRQIQHKSRNLLRRAARGLWDSEYI